MRLLSILKKGIVPAKKILSIVPQILIKISNSRILRNTKIQVRLIASFMIVSLIPLIAMGVISYNKSSSAVVEKIETYSLRVIEQTGVNVDIVVQKFLDISMRFITDTSFTQNLSDLAGEDPMAALDANQKINDKFTDVFGVNTDNFFARINISDDKQVSFGQTGALDSQGEKFFTDMHAINEENQGAPSITLLKDNNGSELIILTRSLNTDKGPVDLFIGVSPKYIYNVFDSVDLGKGSNIFVLDSSGRQVSSRGNVLAFAGNFSDKSLMDKLKKNKENNQYTFTSNINGEKSLVAFYYIQKSDWYLITTIPYSYLNSEVSQIRSAIIFIILLCFALALILSYLISNSISHPLKKLTGNMKEAAEGNFSANIREMRKDETGEVTRNFGRMISNIRTLIDRVNQSAQNVLNNTEKITNSVERSNNVTTQISATIQEVAKGASDQATEITVAVSHMNKLSDDINNTGRGISAVSSVVEDTRRLSENALQSVNALNDKTSETNSVAEKIINDINGLNKDMKEIKKIVKVIVAISEQTNLLSLNAAIEAARAGEAGRGFAVVADEVKKLADQSKEASITINNIINTIQEKTQETVNAADKVGAVVKEQMDAVKETDDAFKTIMNSMLKVTAQIETANSLVQEILNSKEKAMSAMENVSAVSEEAAATAEEVSASTQEQLATISELYNFTRVLDKVANELDESISSFKV